jgi:hypothetical protein
MLRAEVRAERRNGKDWQSKKGGARSRAEILRLAAAVLVLGSASAGLALAHHSGAAFNRSEVRTIEGEVEEWRWSNPHSWLRISVTGEGDTAVEWNFEATSSALLVRQGWRRTSFDPGERVSVHYNPLRDDGVGGNLVGVTKADGTVHGRAPQ